MRVRVRRCREEDLPQVQRLSRLWEREGLTYGYAENSIPTLEGLLGPCFFVADLASDIVGYALGTMYESDGLAVITRGEAYLDILEVYVHPDHRSRVIGTELVLRLIGAAEEAGVGRCLVSSATKDWQRVIPFYRRLRWEVWTVQMYR